MFGKRSCIHGNKNKHADVKYVPQEFLQVSGEVHLVDGFVTLQQHSSWLVQSGQAAIVAV